MNNIDPYKDYIYVLKLIEDRYYIGRSQNVIQRIEDHFAGNGSIYTKKYKPLSVIEIVEEKTIDDEKNKTIEYIKKYSWEKVRGYVWCRVDYKNPINIENNKEDIVSCDDVDENIKRLYCYDNKDIIEIGLELNITPGSVAYRLKKMNVITSKKQAKGYYQYITSDPYKLICKNYKRENNVQQKEKQNTIIIDKNNFKENISKAINNIREFKMDTSIIKNNIRQLINSK
jgi:predicted GIY-YIG superfamily endonuclease